MGTSEGQGREKCVAVLSRGGGCDVKEVTCTSAVTDPAPPAEVFPHQRSSRVAMS